MEAKRKTKNNKKKITAKKPVVLRYRAPKIVKTFDEGVPVNLLNFSGLKLNKPTIKLTEQNNLSPFIVSFIEEKPKTVEESPLVQLNFAVPEYEFKKHQTSIEESLSHDDLAEQFLEEERTPLRSKQTWLKTTKSWPSLATIRQALKNFTSREEIIEPIAEQINLSDFGSVYSTLDVNTSQNKVIENEFVNKFDLPEMEEGEKDESDILTWDDVVRSTATDESLEDEKVVDEELEIIDEKPIGWNEWWSTVKIPVHFGSFEMSAGWHRALIAFVLLSFIFVLPLHAMETINDLRGIKNNLSSTSMLAVNKLNEAVSLIAADSASAATSFEAAKKDFSAAKSSIDGLSTAAEFLLSILPSTRNVYTSGVNLISAGEEISAAGEKISQGLAAMQADGLDTTGKLAILTKTFESAIPSLEEAEKNLKKVDPSVLPAEYQTRFTELQTLLPAFLASAKNITEFSDVLATLLGADGKKRYLLLFQNNTEIRPTGGFIGSFAILDVSHGKITNLEVPEGGSYDLQGSLKENVVAPLPLQLISARWEFQDSNWFPDFPTSARQTLEFYNNAGWPTVDGVVAVNATFVSSLLSLLGPVEMNQYDRTIDSENFLFETQKMVEKDYVNYSGKNSERKEAAPKAFIGDLAEVLLGRIEKLDTNFLLQSLDIIQNGLIQKDIQLYFPNEEIQKVAQKFDWTGEIKQTDSDYLMISDSNLGGGKTDLVINEKVDLKVSVQPDGRIINTLTINRIHNGLNGAMFTGVNNVNFMRVYVPKGSHLISADGFSIPDISLFEKPGNDWASDADVLFTEENTEIDPASGTMISEEFGKTVFGNWTQTKPGETSTITFVYELPFTLSEPTGLVQMVKDKVGLDNGITYSLLTQKQSGFLNRQTVVTIDAPNLKTVWSSEETNQKTFNNETDSFLSFVFE